ncbi:Cof-type HAD-IIB family hydrolase [Evansella clarkii]|uniref:Cof-type HAD-IIB family hydrolase n=1 Tax=Evansella clarkii TaxID=79879 RepID=UPI000997361B|nr:Cof-type HAD-IIB family hydrolase [Evansella clarkii]
MPDDKLNGKEIKLIALDMDGTLLNNEHEISEENRKAIFEAEEKGVTVVLSTGRTLATCRDYAQALGLSSYLVTSNGSEIYNESGEIVERNLLETEYIQMMVELTEKHPTKFWAAAVEDVFLNKMPENISDYNWIKFGFDVEDDRVREEIYNVLSQKGSLEISNSSPTNLEINALGINKAKALKRVCELLGISMENVIAMGDSLNDIAMIEEAGIGVAMGNAQEMVKKTADYVTGTNLEDGVAKAIRKFVL